MKDLSGIKGIGPTRLASLRAVGICSLRDLLYLMPQRYEDRTTPVPVCDTHEGPVLVRGTVKDAPKLNRFNGLTRVTAVLQDDTGTLALVWFNQPWVMQQLPVGETVMLYGRLAVKNGRRTLQNPVTVTEPSIVPVYKAIGGIQPRNLRMIMERALEQVDDCCPETLPRELRLRHGLCELNYAIRQAHFPTDLAALQIARRRLAFEEMLFYFALLGNGRTGVPGFAIPLDNGAEERFWASLPFRPTGAQKRVLHEIAQDLTRDRAMSRLVQGDVGCGKTALAFGAIALACGAGYQCAMMAPTEILAQQHFASAKAMLEPLGIRCGLLTGSMKASEKKKARAALESGEWQAVFGTHALISQGVAYTKLGLVITDEQHRFGVRQRSSLQDKGESDGRAPHVLVMSATPIPRTLALILYGDLDLSVVDELPPGRIPVRTRLVPQEKRSGMYGFLRQEIAKGRQAYVVCPLVEDSEQLDDVRSARATWEALTQHELSGLRVGLTWGEQKPDEKARVLEDFTSGAMDVLVSTTVIEVGVNVPNATVMVIENAERFGLSQLHQLRGRVGRGSEESWCFLLAGGHETERLRILTQTNDGFEVARRDLELRGPGDLMGTRQSGEPIGGMLPGGDVRMLEEACACMKCLRDDPSLKEERMQVEREAEARLGASVKKIALN